MFYDIAVCVEDYNFVLNYKYSCIGWTLPRSRWL